MYVIILNYKTGLVDILSITNKPENADFETYITEDKKYNLKDTSYMIVDQFPIFNLITDDTD